MKKQSAVVLVFREGISQKQAAEAVRILTNKGWVDTRATSPVHEIEPEKYGYPVFYIP